MRKQFLFPPAALLLFLGAIALSSCAPSREYRKPDIAVPPAYRGSSASLQGKDTTSVSSMPYAAFFTDATLRGLIDSAIVNNPDLQIALKNIDYTRQALNAARLGNIPSLGIGADASLSHPSDNGPNAIKTGDKNSRDYTAYASMSWEADIWGKIRSRKKSALASYLRTAEAAKTVKTRLVADVAQGYYNLLMLDEQLDVTKKNLALADTTLSMMKLQFNAGMVTSLAVQQQEATRALVALSIPVTEQKISVQENALSILAGRMPGPVKREAKLFSIAISDDLPAGVPASLLQNRPDVRAAELGVRASHADMGEAEAGLYPSLKITAEGGVNALRESSWFSFPGSLFSVVQGSLLQPVFQQGQLRAKYEQTKIKRDQSGIEFRQAVLKAVGEVSDVLVQLEKLKTEELLAAERATTLRKAVSNAGLLFRSGMATYLEVMVAQTNALQAELALADIRRQHLAAMAELYRALGGGWK
jgi:outer membrane protein, multidrug efflux system